ncbi:MAG: hypothetical protein WAK96_08730 [Desulfobaccales bacterium]
MAELSPEAEKMILADKYRRKVDPVQKCTEIIEAALKEYGCSFQVVMVPQVIVVKAGGRGQGLLTSNL